MSIKTFFKNTGDKIVKASTKAGLKFKDASPKIMVIGGTIGLVAAGVIAVKKTIDEYDAVIEQHTENLKKIKELRAAAQEGEEVLLPDGSEYTEDTYKKHLAFTYIRTGGRLIKVYAPALILALLSVFSILKGYKIIEGRHLAAVAEAYGLKETFKKYRGRVAERFGEAVEQELFVDGEHQLITEEETDPETGEKKNVTKDTLVAKRPEERDIYTYIFDAANCPYSWNRNPGYNYQYLVSVQNQANDYLKRHGAITLYEILKQLGFQDVPAETMTIGWMLDNPTGYGDNYVDFGICPLGDYDDVGYFKGGLPDYLLNFNCDGDIQASMKLMQEKKRAQKKNPKAVIKK